MKTASYFTRWSAVVIYAAAMAWVESAVVYYLRTMIDRIDPYQPYPLPKIGQLGGAELVRELATVVMLAAVGWLAGRNGKSRFGFFLIGFGVWDIFYYVFLKVMTGWPHALTDWDLLFLLPLPWWGPVWAPVAIATLMILGGTLAGMLSEASQQLGATWRSWILSWIGCATALYVFTTDAIQTAMVRGNFRYLLPVEFDTTLFVCALVLMSLPVIQILLTFIRRSQNTDNAPLNYLKGEGGVYLKKPENVTTEPSAL
jgi:hypothetical protein